MNWFFSESASTHCAKDCFATMARTRPENWDTLKTDTTSGILLAKDVPPAQFAVLVSGGAANGPLFAATAAPRWPTPLLRAVRLPRRTPTRSMKPERILRAETAAFCCSTTTLRAII